MKQYMLTIVTTKRTTTTKTIKAVDHQQAHAKAATMDKPAMYDSKGDYVKVGVQTVKELK